MDPEIALAEPRTMEEVKNEAMSGDRFTMILYANAALQASVAGMQKVLGHLHTRGSLDGVMPLLAGFEERQRLVSKPQFDALEKKYALE